MFFVRILLADSSSTVEDGRTKCPKQEGSCSMRNLLNDLSKTLLHLSA
jgi:hypothetical protein